jgi:hypothetical protein
MSAITAVMNATKANAPNGIANTVVNSVGNAVNAVGNAVGIANNNKNRGLANLGGILTTPANRR